MNTRLLSPRAHAITDYLLVGSLLVVPRLLSLNKQVKKLYTAESVALMSYIALTDTPVALKSVIPFRLHGKIDPFNVAHFALLSFTKPFRKDKKAVLFNMGFTALAGIAVLLTDWKGKTN